MNCKLHAVKDIDWLSVETIAQERISTIALLIKRGADISVENNHGETPLLLAVQNNSTAVVKLLLQHGGELQANMLITAPSFRNQELVWLLLDHSPQTDAKALKPALHRAIQLGQEEIVWLLVEHDVDVEAKTLDGRRMKPLHLAVGTGHSVHHGRIPDSTVPPAVIERLLIYRANIEARGASGRTPLHVAVSNNALESARELLDWGAVTSARGNDGRTPYECVFSKYRKERQAVSKDHL
ncbi:ankyrin repeat-containing domain protein [Sphaerosporella brunnea]|uniref:Ankyrin repeat-containing domain protein n=1 Tax=Sphaerosporella brunnea TaxID=1250544 RepID=A0A5J5F927_9PEZI|nr:ankyrin repeat-containing domain protein [Sphaerosporella brunnea]